MQIVEVEGPQLVRAADDLALVQGYPAHFVNAGQAELASNALQYSTVDDLYYAIRFVSRSSHRNDSRIRQFVDIYQNSPAVAAQIDKSFAGDAKLYSLPWRSAEICPHPHRPLDALHLGALSFYRLRSSRPPSLF